MACGWKRVQVPATKTTYLTAIAAASPNDVWFVGERGAYGHERTLVMHYNGRSVRTFATPNPFSRSNRLYGVVAFGRRDVWAVGEGVSKTKPISHYEPLVLHYDGIRWRRVPAPGITTEFGSLLSDVAGTAGDDVWAVGLSRGHW
jgi:hypothetical protein